MVSGEIIITSLVALFGGCAVASCIAAVRALTGRALGCAAVAVGALGVAGVLASRAGSGGCLVLAAALAIAAGVWRSASRVEGIEVFVPAALMGAVGMFCSDSIAASLVLVAMLTGSFMLAAWPLVRRAFARASIMVWACAAILLLLGECIARHAASDLGFPTALAEYLRMGFTRLAWVALSLAVVRYAIAVVTHTARTEEGEAPVEVIITMGVVLCFIYLSEADRAPAALATLLVLVIASPQRRAGLLTVVDAFVAIVIAARVGGLPGTEQLGEALADPWGSGYTLGALVRVLSEAPLVGSGMLTDDVALVPHETDALVLARVASLTGWLGVAVLALCVVTLAAIAWRAIRRAPTFQAELIGVLVLPLLISVVSNVADAFCIMPAYALEIPLVSDHAGSLLVWPVVIGGLALALGGVRETHPGVESVRGFLPAAQGEERA